MNWCGLNSTLSKIGITDSKNCDTCHKSETTSHYLLHCTKYHHMRQTLLNEINTIKPSLKVNTELLLHGSVDLDLPSNYRLMNAVQQYIHETGRFQYRSNPTNT